MFLRPLSRTRSGDAKNIEKIPPSVYGVGDVSGLLNRNLSSFASGGQEADVDADCERWATSVGQKKCIFQPFCCSLA